jgi:hypothetical protein
MIDWIQGLTEKDRESFLAFVRKLFSNSDVPVFPVSWEYRIHS